MLGKFRQNRELLLIANNTGWLLFERAVAILVGLAITVWVARYLGPSDFGLLNYAMSFVALFATVATLGLNGIAPRELIKQPERTALLLGTSFMLRVAGAFVVLALVAAAVVLASNDSLTNTLIFIIAATLLFQSVDVIDYFFQARGESKRAAQAKLVQLAVSVATRVGLILVGAPLIFFALALLLDSVILASALAAIYFMSGTGVGRWPASIQLAKNLLKESWPLIMSGVVISIYMRIDQVMIKEFLGASAVGNYAAALKLSEAWYFIPIMVTRAVLPAIITAREMDQALYLRRLQRLCDLLVWFAIIIAVVITFGSDFFISFLYGESYADAAAVLPIHIWTSVFVFMGVVSDRWLLVENRQIYSFYRSMAGVTLNIALNFVLIPRYGITGAAVATLVAQTVASYLSYAFVKHGRVIFAIQSRALIAPFRYLLGR